MLYSTIPWTTAVMLMYLSLSMIFQSGSAFQCSQAYSYKVCVKDSELSLNHKLLEKSLDDVDYYDEIICSCAFETDRAGYEHFAIRENDNQKTVCFAINYSPQSSKRNKLISAVFDELNGLVTQTKCPRRCDKQGGCVRLGTGDYSAVYHVISSTITLPTTPKTTVRTEILPKSTHKPFWRPSPPILED